MSRFKKKYTSPQGQIATASLPDIVFLLLFFFMVSATTKSVEELVEYKIPVAHHLTKAEKKKLVKEIRIGIPKDKSFGIEARLSDGERLIKLTEIPGWVTEQRASLDEVYKDQMIVMIKADSQVEMGLINDLQTELRKVNARKILYRTLDKPDE